MLNFKNLEKKTQISKHTLDLYKLEYIIFV
jgi:hypothetical protein